MKTPEERAAAETAEIAIQPYIKKIKELEDRIIVLESKRLRAKEY